MQLYRLTLAAGEVEGPLPLQLPVTLPHDAALPLWRWAGGALVAVASDGGVCTVDPLRTSCC